MAIEPLWANEPQREVRGFRVRVGPDALGFAKEADMKTAKGFVAVVAGLGLFSMAEGALAGDSARKKQDARLEQKVEAQIQQDVRLARQPVNVAVKKGVLTLTGTVDTAADKLRAAQLAGTVGAVKIDNQLAVVEASDDGSDPNRKASPQEQEERRALSDPRRRDPMVGTMPSEPTGSREIRPRTTGMPDPVLEKQEAEKKQREEQKAKEKQSPAPTPRDGSGNSQ
jgi:hypothetical protein